MTRVVIYTPYSSDQPGAAGMRVHYLAEALRNAENTTTIFTLRDGKGWALAKKIADEKPSLVIGTSPPLPPNWGAWLGAKLVGAPFILDAKEDGRAIQLLNKTQYTLKEHAYLHLRRFLYTHAQECWFLTPADLKEAHERYGVSPSRSELVPNGVDSRIQFNSTLRKKIRTELGVKGKERVIVYAGSVGDEELEEFLVHYFRKPALKKVHLLLVLAHDTSAENKKTISKIEELRSRNPSFNTIIRKNQPLEDMSGLLSAADYGIIPWPDSFPTSLPVKLFDYAGTGLPVVAKAPAQGSLSNWLGSNSHVGMCVSEWGAFFSALKKEMKKTRTYKIRASRAKHAHTYWSRSHICAQTIKRLKEKGILPRTH